MARYTIEGGRAGKQRLDVLAAVMQPLTAALLRRAGVSAGSRCLDVGCGGGHVSRELARIVGPAGRVLGIDLDAEAIALARADAEADGLQNLVFRVGDAARLDRGPHDVAYARFLLSHVADPRGVVAAMVSTLAPGGTVIVEDVDFSGCFCYPDCPAYRSYVELYRETVRRRGGNADIGPMLPALLRSAGLEDIAVNVCQPAGMSGDAKLINVVTLERISQAIVSEGVATAQEVREAIAELRAYTEDPTTVMGCPRVVQAWGRRAPPLPPVELGSHS
jgi:SAM-dependent methyltransferase